MKTLPLLLGSLMVTALMNETVEAAGLSRKEKEIVKHVDAQMPDTMSLLRDSVNIPSGTLNLAGVRRVGDLYRSEFDELGMRTEWVELPAEMKRAGHLLAETKGKKGKRVLIIGHLDTVLEDAKYEERDGRIWGSGVMDMKGGNAIVIAALRALHAAGALKDRRLVVIFTGDEEEAGVPVEVTRRRLIDEAKRSDYALAFEETIENTGTVARRGVTNWRLEVSGQIGHSSAIFTSEMGSGAIFEVSRILNAFHDELRGEQYLTFNPSVLIGGTDVTYDDHQNSGTGAGKTNVIPQKAIAEGDLRFISNEQRESAKARMQTIVARSHPLTTSTIHFDDKYPAMAPTDANYALLGILSRASQDLGFGEVPAWDPGRRGAGDISFVAPFVTSLDGLGTRGSGGHTHEEWAESESIPMLVKRAAILMYRLTR